MTQVFISFGVDGVCLFFQSAPNLTPAFFLEAFTVLVAIWHCSDFKSQLRTQDMTT